MGASVFSTTVGFAHRPTVVYTYVSCNLKFIHTIEAHLNFMYRYRQYLVENHRFFQDVLLEIPRIETPDYDGGRVFKAVGVQPNLPSISKSVPPPPDEVMTTCMNETIAPVLPKECKEAWSEWGHANVHPNDEKPVQNVFRGSNTHQSFLRVPRPTTAKDMFAFLKTRAPYATLSRVTTAVTMAYNKDYTRANLEVPDYGDDKVLNRVHTLPLSPGQATFTCADTRAGNTTGTKPEMSFLVRNIAVSLVRAFKDVLTIDFTATNKPYQPISYWAGLINRFFLDRSWKFFFALYVQLFRKAETIKINKTPRLIWGVDMLSIMVDFMVKKPAMVIIKNQFERGFTHGIIAKGAGYNYVFKRVVNFYLEQLNTPPHAATRREFCAYLKLKPDASDDELGPLLGKMLVGKDDDVEAWDFSQFTVTFEAMHCVYLFRYGINPKACSLTEALFIMLFCYTSHMRATTMARIKKTGEEFEFNRVITQMLPSGYLGTASDGSIFHSFIQHEAQSYKWVMAKSMLRAGGGGPLTRLCLSLACLGTPAMHHSDDFLDLVISLVTVVHSNFNDQYHYACNNLVLKFEPSNTVRQLPPGLTWERLGSLIPDYVRSLVGYNHGTYEGTEFNNGGLLRPVVLFNPARRYETSYKSFLTTYDVNGVITVQGATFLRWNFVLHNAGFFLLRRDEIRLLAKLRNMSTTILKPAQWVLRLRAYMYLAVGNRVLYDSLSKCEDLYRVKLDLTDAAIATELVNAPVSDMLTILTYNIEGLTGEHICRKPTWEQIIEFYGPAVDISGKIRERMLMGLDPASSSYSFMIREGEPDSNLPAVRSRVVAPEATIKRRDLLRAMLDLKRAARAFAL